MFPITITIHNFNELEAVLAALDPPESRPPVALTDLVKPDPKSDPKSDPKPQAEKTAPAAPTPPAAATPPSAATAPTAAPAPADKPVDYATLSGAVLKLMKLDPTAPAKIAAELGFKTFKEMKEAENAVAVFAKAYPLVQAAIAQAEAV